jgi:hypothetical protein
METQLKVVSGKTLPDYIGLTNIDRGLPKRQKRRLMACEISDCFHPAHSALLVDGRTRWHCKCHDPVNPAKCMETKEREELVNFRLSGDCIFCGSPRSHNPIHGLDGKITFVCEGCYRTSTSELRKYYRH